MERGRSTTRSRLSLVLLFAALAVVSTASAGVGGGVPPGKLCGSVSGASWKYEGQSGTRYNVTALPATSCAAAMKAVSATDETEAARRRARPAHPRRPERVPLRRARGSSCPPSAGFCGGTNGARFFWAPRLNS